MMNSLIPLHSHKRMGRYSMIEEFEEDLDESTSLQLWLSDLSTDSATRNLGAVLIGIGGMLGFIIGIMLISGNVSDILSGQVEQSGGTADVEGIVISELVSNSSGAEGISEIDVLLYDEDGIVIGSDSTDSGGRFSIEDVPRRSVKLEVAHPGNITVQVLLIPGDHSQITITLREGEGTQVLDMEGGKLSEGVSFNLYYICNLHSTDRACRHLWRYRGEKRNQLQEDMGPRLSRSLERWTNVRGTSIHTIGNGPCRTIQGAIL